MPAPLRVGLAGLGTVGQGVVKLLLEDPAALAARAGRAIQLTRVASRTPRPEVPLGGASFSTEAGALADARDVDAVVETIAGADAHAALAAAKALFEGAVAAGKHVVTANKALIAIHGNALLPAAQAAGVQVGFEAAVAGGVPIIGALTQGLAANRIEWVAGIVNGTSNYILTAMAQRGEDFQAALAEAQRLGYAEADPTFDVEGIDAAHKIAILASLAFGTPLNFNGVYTEGIAAIAREDIAYAAELGFCIKHLGIARRGALPRVHPCLTPKDGLIAKVDGVLNAVQVHGHPVGATVHVGPGAGAGPTASAIVANLIEVARGASAPVPALAEAAPTTPVEALRCSHYLRIPAADAPGVFAQVAEALSSRGVSIQSVIQRGEAAKEGEAAQWVPIVILTDAVAEGEMRDAVAAIEALDGVRGVVQRIRVADFDGAV